MAATRTTAMDMEFRRAVRIKFRPVQRGMECGIDDIWQRPSGPVAGERPSHRPAIAKEQDVRGLKQNGVHGWNYFSARVRWAKATVWQRPIRAWSCSSAGLLSRPLRYLSKSAVKPSRNLSLSSFFDGNAVPR